MSDAYKMQTGAIIGNPKQDCIKKLYKEDSKYDISGTNEKG